MQLTEHFSLSELVESDTALRLGIDNTPPAELIDNLRKTAELGELIRSALNEGRTREVYVIVTSGYRCEALEHVLCQKDFEHWCDRRQLIKDDDAWRLYFKNKSHPAGRTIDLKAPRFGTPRQIAEFLMKRPEIMAHIDQMIEEGDWLHVSWSNSPRGEVKTARFDANGYPNYTKGLA